MPLNFHKMHGAGNDFVLIDARDRDFSINAAQASSLSDRHCGIGCDQILVLRNATRTEHVARYEIWNSDGTPAGQCGNGARCIGLYLEMNGDTGGAPFTLESPAGPVTMRRCTDNEFEIEMGVPSFEADSIPVSLEAVDNVYHLDSPWGVLEFGAVSMGNPHALLVIPDIGSPEVPEIGRFISTHEAFPEGCNVGFAQVVGPGEIKLRVVERGAGETLACGSGACAAVAILKQCGRTGGEVDVFLPGGHLVIKWRESNGPVLMKGPARHVFRGTLNE